MSTHKTDGSSEAYMRALTRARVADIEYYLGSDWIDYQVQKQTGELTDSDFDPRHGTCGKLDNGGHFGVLKAPSDYEPPTKLEPGAFIIDRIVYITLEGVVGMVNKYILGNNNNNYEIKFDDSYSAIDYEFDTGRLWSPCPTRVLIPYAKNTPENEYGGRMNCQAFIKRNSEAYENFRVDNPKVGARGILIGRDVFREIINNLDSNAASEDASTEETEKADSSLNLIDFFKKIFAVIRENTGGDWNFTLERSEGDLDSNGKKFPGAIWIVNKNSPVKGDPITPLILSPTSGKNGVRDMSMEGSVPEDIRAQAFGGSPQVTRSQKSIEVIVAERRKLETEINAELAELKRLNRFARAALHLGNYDSEATAAAKGIVKRIVNAMSVEDTVKKNKLIEPTPYPLKLKLVIDGIEGFRFGDTVTSDYLPDRYNKPNKDGTRVVFTITKYTHEFKDNDWSTSIESVCRMAGD